MTTLVFLIVCLLAFWKLWEIFFPEKKKLHNQIQANQNLTRFFAEFTYKLMNKKTEYTTAPKDIYIWLAKNYEEWEQKKLI